MTPSSDVPPAATRTWLPPSLATLHRDGLFIALLLALALLAVLAPEKVPTWPRLVDWPTIAALAGLLLLTKAVETSGALHRVAHWLLDRAPNERALALGLVSLTAVLSMLLTNDVALFAMVPLTLGICRITNLPSTRLIVFEALAVNAGSALTPIGNPQNLFLWQRSGASFGQFVLWMTPLVAALLVVLLAVTSLAFRARPIGISTEAKPALDRSLLALALLLYLPFLVLADVQQAVWALAALALVFALLRPRVLALIDWGLLLVFVLMFVDLRLLATLDGVRDAMATLALGQPRHVFWTSIGASQFISNVPAAIALVEYSHDWRAIAWGVNVGGFGLLIGSLANLIALRMAAGPRKYLVFHAWSLPFLLAAALIGYALL